MSKRPAAVPTNSPSCKKARKTFKIEEKVKILDELKSGDGATVIARRYGVNESSIRSIKNNEEKIRKAYACPDISKDTRHIKAPVYNEMQEALVIWLEDVQRRELPLSGAMIQSQALIIKRKIEEKAGIKESESKFTASAGWLQKFIKRVGLRNVSYSGEASSANKEAAEEAKIKLREAIKEGRYTAHQVWNCDETGLYWKRMPKKTYLMKQEAKAPGFKQRLCHSKKIISI